MNEVNDRKAQWRSQAAPRLQRVSAFTELNRPLSYSVGFSKCYQTDFLERIETLNLCLHEFSIRHVNPFILIRNIDASAGQVKHRRCSASALQNWQAMFQLGDGTEITLTRTSLEKKSNEGKPRRWKQRLRLIGAGTVHRSHDSRSCCDGWPV
jgi:hypothetical protein